MSTTRKADSSRKAVPRTPAGRAAEKSAARSAKSDGASREKTAPGPRATAGGVGVRAEAAGKKATTVARVPRGSAAIRRKKVGTTAPSPPAERRPRHAIYIDVENTSSKAALLSVIDALKIDRQKESIEVSAVGNWRTVGQDVGRELASLGAQLVHSAPARGVRDWSDLWIAVAAGGWIARAVPGDILEIVSNDRAFDAVGDAAAAQGVLFKRVPHRRHAAAAGVERAHETTPAERPRAGRRRRSRRTAEAVATAATSASTPSTKDEAHGASREQMIELVGQLTHGRSSPWVNLDVLESALKRQGFARPANSPRLVTRLRRLKDFEVDAHGRVRIVSPGDARE